MKITQRNMSLEKLLEVKDKIDLNPLFQRGPAWKAPRQALLIDSILREMDIPKIYLRAQPAGSAHAFSAVDGQQRLTAIWKFHANDLTLEQPDPLPKIDGHDVNGKTFSTLPKTLRSRFLSFQVSIADIKSATSDEISNLFSRLQMGVSLNPAELRNALGGAMQYMIHTIAQTHEFFTDCRIANTRYKREDYVAHIFAIAKGDGAENIKAPDLKNMIKLYATGHKDALLELTARVGDALNVVAEVNQKVDYRITQKWMFVDLAWLVMQHQAAGSVVDPNKMSSAYTRFENLRRKHSANPDRLIRGSGVTTLDRHLYRYIVAFKSQGGVSGNLTQRNKALRAFFNNILAS